MPGFPSYCAVSLLMITSSITCCRCSCIGHRDFSHTRPDNRPNQVRLRYVPSTSYRFLQTPPLAGDALASRIQFPMNRAWSLTSSDGVCQLRWANKKNLRDRSHRGLKKYGDTYFRACGTIIGSESLTTVFRYGNGCSLYDMVTVRDVTSDKNRHA